MQATEQSVDRLNTCECPCVPESIDRARMTAACQHHQALITHMDHESLVVMDERIGLPGAVDFRIVYREALFEVRAAMDLAGDEDQPFHEIGRTACFDKLHAFLLEQAAVRSRGGGLVPVGKNDLTV